MMNVDRWDEVEGILDRLLDLPKEERPATLERLCAHDRELRREVALLLRAAELDTPLDRSLEDEAGALIASAVDLRRDPGLPEELEIGAYRVERLLGQGGMGRVYLGHRADGHFEQRVALKLLRRTYLDSGSHRRFLRERQILAGLRHPNIARLFDGGVTGDGVPYLALEYIDGKSLIDYCREKESDQEERIRLFLQACEGVGYAHRRGVVHRDIKPSNLLVEETPEGEPVVFVLDFGIASQAEHSDVTATGQIVGTLGYMSPEQARGERSVLGPKSDIFSLGVVLYELLTDRRPFEGANPNEILLELLQGDPIPIRRRRPDLSADLATIVMVCLAREPQRRYASVAALAEDLHRFLDGEPIAARPVGLVTRLVLKARRRPAAAALVLAAVLAVVISAVALAVGAVKYTRDLQRERNLAVEARADAEELLEFLLQDLQAGLRPLGRLDLLESVARQSLAYYESRASEELSAEELRRHGLALFNTSVVLDEQGHEEETLRALARYQEVARRLEELEPGPAAEYELARAELAIGDTLGDRGSPERALTLIQPALERARQLARSKPEGLAWRALLFDCLKQAGWLWTEIGDFERAEAAVEEAVALSRELAPDPKESVLWRHRLGEAFSYLGLLEYQRGQMDEALAAFQQALPISLELTALHPSNAVWLAERQLLHTRIGFTLEDLGRARESLESYRQALELSRRLVDLEPTNANWRRELSVAASSVASVMRQLGDLDGALEHLQQSLDISRDLGRRNPENPSAQNDLAWDLLELGRIHRDRADRTAAVAAWTEGEKVMAPVVESSPQGFYLDTYVQLLLELGLRNEARPHLRILTEQDWHSPELDELREEHGLLTQLPT